MSVSNLRIAIIGAGLIGASIARAAMEYGVAGSVSLYDADADVRRRAAAIGLGDVADAPSEETNLKVDVFCLPARLTLRRSCRSIDSINFGGVARAQAHEMHTNKWSLNVVA